ncbi:MAG: lipid-A-disaccharide synthase [Gammaproteobacteria bacterium]|nr:lipid-A-disaccharide synthase [Gammaproteobacteria bacterium]
MTTVNDTRSAGPLRVAIAAGEASGDTLGAGLIEALRKLSPQAQFFGIAGPGMISAGCEPWYRTEELSVMGLAEILRHLPRLLKLRRQFIKRLQAARPDVFIGIDSPDFNLPVEAALKKSGVPTVQYVSPQVWAWRQSRVAGIRDATDLVLCVLPFEVEFYRTHDVNSVFVGHPLADEVPVEVDAGDARQSLGLPAATTILAVLPGSRSTEVSRLARPFLETGKWLQQRHPGLQVVVALVNDAIRDRYLQATKGIELDPPPRLVVGRAREVIAAADVVLTASGTASLEAALLKRPMVVAYIISRLTHRLLRVLGLNKLEYFSLPNLLAGRELVPEYLQRQVCPTELGPALERYLNPQGEHENWRDAFTAIHQQLRCNASDGAARAVLGLLSERQTSTSP